MSHLFPQIFFNFYLFAFQRKWRKRMVGLHLQVNTKDVIIGSSLLEYMRAWLWVSWYWVVKRAETMNQWIEFVLCHLKVCFYLLLMVCCSFPPPISQKRTQDWKVRVLLSCTHRDCKWRNNTPRLPEGIVIILPLSVSSHLTSFCFTSKLLLSFNEFVFVNQKKRR